MWREQALQPGAATALDAATLEAIAGDVPSASLDKGQVVGQPLVQIMLASGLQSSKAASKRMIKVSRQTCMVAAVAPSAATGFQACTSNQYCKLVQSEQDCSIAGWRHVSQRQMCRVNVEDCSVICREVGCKSTMCASPQKIMRSAWKI